VDCCRAQRVAIQTLQKQAKIIISEVDLLSFLRIAWTTAGLVELKSRHSNPAQKSRGLSARIS
jgi:hypothetical protein